MIGANSLSGTVNLGAKEIKCPCQLRILIRIQNRCSSREMSCVNLGFRPKPSEEPKMLLGESSENKMDLARKTDVRCFKGRKIRWQKGKVESVWDAVEATEARHFPEHLVIMVNGIIGSAEDWRYAAQQFVKKLPGKVIVHRSECNSSMLTFDGVDLMGERLAEEVLSVVRSRPGVRKISFVAHSLGGLVARYAIGRLYEPFPNKESPVLTGKGLGEEHSSYSLQHQEQSNKGRIAGLDPLNFITFATPHLGSRGNKQLPFLFGLPFLERSASQTAHWIVGRTGRHLFLTDNDDGRFPLLLRMVNDCDDLKFISALCSFKRRVAYANANYDHMVGWRTSSIRRQHELPQSHLLVKNQKYPHIVYVERGSAEDIHNEASSGGRGQKVDLEEEMIRGLTQVSWERVDVSFYKSTQRYIAHNTIQIRYTKELLIENEQLIHPYLLQEGEELLDQFRRR